MEIIILRKNEIHVSLFENQKLMVYKEIKKDSDYGNYIDLDETKCKIDTLDKNSEKNRRAAAKYLHEYELVKVLCKKNVISRAYFKLYEIIYNEPFISNENILNCFFICEAPGGFIECVTDIRRKKNLKTEYISISKFDTSIKYDRYLEENNLLYGDITSIECINNTIKIVLQKFEYGLDLITADGGFDIKNYNCQEIVTSKLLLCEIYIALKTQKQGGTFVIKFFDMFTHNSIIYYLILSSFYEYVRIIKPKSSRNCNSERYLVCSNFYGNGTWNASHEDLIHKLQFIILNFKIGNTIIFPNFEINTEIKNKIKTFNNLIVYEQIKTINESIKMVFGKNFYFQNLLLKIFLENKVDHLKNIILYKNILNSRINKCTNFLRNYNINIHQFL
jgi:23S rRNA U2552 (ribose-2'-O)-methylase RlmE/FtsJ